MPDESRASRRVCLPERSVKLSCGNGVVNAHPSPEGRPVGGKDFRERPATLPVVVAASVGAASFMRVRGNASPLYRSTEA